MRKSVIFAQFLMVAATFFGARQKASAGSNCTVVGVPILPIDSNDVWFQDSYGADSFTYAGTSGRQGTEIFVVPVDVTEGCALVYASGQSVQLVGSLNPYADFKPDVIIGVAYQPSLAMVQFSDTTSSRNGLTGIPLAALQQAYGQSLILVGSGVALDTKGNIVAGGGLDFASLTSTIEYTPPPPPPYFPPDPPGGGDDPDAAPVSGGKPSVATLFGAAGRETSKSFVPFKNLDIALHTTVDGIFVLSNPTFVFDPKTQATKYVPGFALEAHGDGNALSLQLIQTKGPGAAGFQPVDGKRIVFDIAAGKMYQVNDGNSTVVVGNVSYPKVPPNGDTPVVPDYSAPHASPNPPSGYTYIDTAAASAALPR